ncbi:beta-galactosidase [Luedemannella flava]
MVPHAGPDSRVFRECVALGADHAALGDLASAPVSASVAILWDDEAWWASQAPAFPSASLDYQASIRAAHGALWRSGVTCDFARPGADLSAYSLVLVPSLYLISDEAAASLRSYVEAGGTLVVWYFSGIADPSPRVRLGGHPGALRDLLGVRVEEWLPLAPGASVALSDGWSGTLWSERVHLAGATAVSTYVDGVLAGLPAVTRHPVGAGRAYYVSTALADLPAFLGGVCAEAGVAPVLPGLPPGVEAVRRRDPDTLIVINHTTSDCSVPSVGTVAAGAYVVIHSEG